MFFPQEQRSETEEIYFDTQESKPRISPFVSPLMPGKVVEHEGYRTKSFKPAYVKDKRRFTPDMPFKRMAGEKIGGEMTPAQRLEKAVAVTLNNQLDCLTRREEVMASEVLRTGKITVEGDGYPAVTVDFGRDASFTKVLTGDNTWDNSSVNILDNLEDWAGAIQSKSGVVAKTVILEPSAWKIFRANPFVQKYLDYRRGTANTLSIDPIILGNEKLDLSGILAILRFGYITTYISKAELKLKRKSCLKIPFCWEVAAVLREFVAMVLSKMNRQVFRLTVIFLSHGWKMTQLSVGCCCNLRRWSYHIVPMPQCV